MPSYTIAKITTYYRDYLHQYYQRHPHLSSLPYEQQYDHLMAQAYGWSDFFAKHLRAMGIEAYEIVANAELLQQTWTREHGIAAAGNEIVFEQLKTLKPDVVFFQDSLIFSSEFLRRVRSEIPSVKLMLGWCCTVYSDGNIERFREYDAMIVCSQMYQDDFQRRGLKTYQMYHGFEPLLLPLIEKDNSYPETDFIFIGSLIPGNDFHDFRQKIIEYLIESNINLEMYANVMYIAPLALLLRRSAFVTSQLLQKIGMGKIAQTVPLLGKAYTLKEMPKNFKSISEIRRKSKSPLYGIDMYKALSRSKIGFNVHAEIAGNYAANVRLFEVTGVGSCLLTDWKKNMNELFEENTEVVLYRSLEECKEKLRWLLDHPQERKEIAKRGQQRIQKNHTLRHRVERLNEIIDHALSKKLR